MQLMPKTARKFERLRSTQKLYDPVTNVKIGSKFFSTLLTRYDGDAALALAAYNAGAKRIEDWVRRYPVKDRILFLDLIPFKETRQYVSAIARNYFWYNTLYPEVENETQQAAPVTPKTAIGSMQKTFRLAGT